MTDGGGTALVFVLRKMPVEREEKNITLSINYNKESQCQMNWGVFGRREPRKSYKDGQFVGRSSFILKSCCGKAWFPYDHPDRPSRLKKCSDHRDDHMETVSIR